MTNSLKKEAAHHASQIGGKRMLRMAEVIERTGLSRTTIWRMVRAGTFPPPKQLGPNSNGWTERVIDDHVDALPTVSYASSDAA